MTRIRNMTDSEDPFKFVFKKLKRRKPPPDYSEVIDISNYLMLRNVTPYLNSVKPDNSGCVSCKDLGLKQHSLWKVFSVNDIPGLIFILNPFTSSGQRFWIRQCMEKYPLWPNITNLGNSVLGKNLWQLYCTNKSQGKQDLWKLRWATLGYHHDWDTKQYCDANRSPFPLCLSNLTEHTASVLGFNIHPEAAIVNYYHLDSTLSGHTDHSELDHSAPLLSFSFGRKAIFMIGGKDKHTSPLSIFVQSGDIIVMSGESRLCYHAVPKIFSKADDESNSWKDGVSVDEEGWEKYEEYLSESRINMNVRQVFKTVVQCQKETNS